MCRRAARRPGVARPDTEEPSLTHLSSGQGVRQAANINVEGRAALPSKTKGRTRPPGRGTLARAAPARHKPLQTW